MKITDKNFLQRLPKVNIFQEQLATLDDQTLGFYKDFLRHKLKFVKKPEEVTEFLKTADFKQGEENFFRILRAFVNPPVAKVQYQKADLKSALARAQHRPDQFKKALKGKKLDISVCADIGCGDGLISKVFAKSFGLTRIDMFEPYVPETPYEVEGIECNFSVLPFEKRKNPEQKYDCFILSAALHHLQNPTEVMQEIKKAIIPGGYLFVREHLPENDQQKRFLDICEKTWSYALTREQPDGMTQIKDYSYPPESYFYYKELYEYIGARPFVQMREINYIVNEWMNYMVFQIK